MISTIQIVYSPTLESDSGLRDLVYRELLAHAPYSFNNAQMEETVLGIRGMAYIMLSQKFAEA